MRVPRWSVFGLLAALLLLGLLTQPPGRERTPTTFGVLPPAYGALYDLLVAVELPVQRSYARTAALAVDTPVWWISSPTLCRSTSPGMDWNAGDWVESGGTAVIFLPAPEHCPLISTLAGKELPQRTGAARHDAGRDADTAGVPEGDAAADPKPPVRGLGGWYGETPASDQILTGSLVPFPRSLRSPGLKAFTTATGWQVRAVLDGAPFVLEAPHGSGRLVVVADARLLSNAVLDRGDNALVAIDLINAFGVPRIDERDNGLRVSDNALQYLLTSPAVWMMAGLCLVGILYAWNGHSVPVRSLVDDRPAAPVLTKFVDSLATLYATSHDYPRVLDAYRNLTVARLRRHFGLPVDIPLAALVERLAGQRGVSPALLSVLRRSEPARDSGSLRAAVARLDRLAEEAMRQ